MAKNDEIMENTELEMTEEAKKALTRKYEEDILGGLLEAARYHEDEEELTNIEIKRKGVTLFRFRIHPLSESEYQKCKKDHTNYKRNRSLGTKVAESVEASDYRSDLIYRATAEEDREKIWDNREAWKKLGVLNGVDMVDVVLKAGEKDMVLEELDRISGFKATLEDVAKN